MYGVNPTSEQWTEDAASALGNYHFEPNTDIFRTLYIKTVKSLQTTNNGTRKYSVVMIDNYNQKNLMINNIIIDCGLGVHVLEECLEDVILPEWSENEKQNSAVCGKFKISLN